MVIDTFRGEYSFLSNFHPCQILYEMIMYPSVEHAYQAAKSEDLHDRMDIAAIPSPGMAKRAGFKLDRRDDWFDVNVGIMRELLIIKFAPGSRLARLLLKTGDAELVEGNQWNDTFWGVCNGRGENHLGKMLMSIRYELGGLV